MRLIGLHGRAGSGKDTFADAYVKRLLSANYYRFGFADAVRDVAKAVFGSRYLTQAEKASVDAFWEPRLHMGPLHPQDESGPWIGSELVTGRRVLQFIGTELFRDHVHPDIWLMVADRKMQEENSEYNIITDVRFDNEARFIREHGGQIIRLINSNQPPLPADVHRSELPISHDLIDMTFSTFRVASLQEFAGATAEQHREEDRRGN